MPETGGRDPPKDMLSTRPLLMMILAVSAVLAVGCAVTGRAIHLPAATIEPTETDRAFARMVRETAAVDPDRQAVFILRFDASLSDEEETELARRALILKGSRHDTWFVHASFSTVADLLDDDHVLWIGEYRDEYKLGRRADTVGAERRWMYVVSFEGNRPEFRAALAGIGVTDIRYDSVLDRYYVYINGEQRDRVITFWWVREVFRPGSRELDRMMRW